MRSAFLNVAKNLKMIAVFSAVAFMMFAYLGIKIDMKTPSREITIGLPFQKNVTDLDPSRVQTLSQAILLRNLYSSLFEYNDDGNLVAGAVSGFQWRNGRLELSFDTRHLVSSGRPLTAEDAYDSFRRLIALDRNLHGSLAQLICLDPARADGTCSGMKIESGKLILSPVSEKAAQQLIPLLATVDFRILPREVIDWSANGFPIKSYEITSGAYSVTSSDSEGNVTLVANTGFHHYSSEIPLRVTIKGQSYRQSIDDFEAGKVDLLTTAVPVTASDLSRFEATIDGLNLNKTYDIRIKLLYFGNSAIQDFSVSERFSMAKLVKLRFDKIALPFEHETNQFFQEFAAGYLSREQSSEIDRLRSQPISRVFKRKISLGLSSGAQDRWKHFFASNQEFDGRYQEATYFQIPAEERPDIFSGANDVAFDRSSSVISYNVNIGIFGPVTSDSRKWLKAYTLADSTEEQIRLLNLKHFETLENCFIYPLGASPYLVLSRNGWRASLNPYFSSTELWRIKRN